MTVQEDYQPVFMGKCWGTADRPPALPQQAAALLRRFGSRRREHGWISDRIMAEVAKCSPDARVT